VAREAAREVLAEDDTDFGANLVMGQCALEMGDWEGARLHFERANASRPSEWVDGNWAVPNLLAWAHLRAGDPAAALPLAEAALAGAPDNPAILDTCGEARIRTGDVEGGLPLLERSWSAGQAHPGSARAYTACSLALAWEARGDAQSAAHWWAEAERLDPGCPALPLGIGASR
jgi:tetratricopeptide (TPR) repeat protein